MSTVAIDDARAEAAGDAAWLDVAAHKGAVFQSDQFALVDKGDLTVTGLLTLKGFAVPMTLTGALVVGGALAHTTLEGAIMRLSHHVGLGQDALALAVVVRATVVAHRAPIETTQKGRSG